MAESQDNRDNRNDQEESGKSKTVMWMLVGGGILAIGVFAFIAYNLFFAPSGEPETAGQPTEQTEEAVAAGVDEQTTLEQIEADVAAIESELDADRDPPPAEDNADPPPARADADWTPRFDARDRWQSYEAEALPIRLSHPGQIRAEAVSEDLVAFTFWGPSQRAGEALEDAIQLEFTIVGYAWDVTFEQVVQEDAERVQAEKGLTLAPTAVDLAGRQGMTYRSAAPQARTYLYLPLPNRRILKITNATQDPAGYGYQEIVDLMLDSLTIR
jgi:hypothetical protein